MGRAGRRAARYARASEPALLVGRWCRRNQSITFCSFIFLHSAGVNARCHSPPYNKRFGLHSLRSASTLSRTSSSSSSSFPPLLYFYFQHPLSHIAIPSLHDHATSTSFAAFSLIFRHLSSSPEYCVGFMSQWLVLIYCSVHTCMHVKLIAQRRQRTRVSGITPEYVFGQLMGFLFRSICILVRIYVNPRRK